MTLVEQTLNLTSKPSTVCKRPVGGLRFDLTVSLLSLWLIVGVFFDGFAHHNLPDSLETFFTPWHGFLYTGFLVLAGFILFHQFRNMANGHAANGALPAGYTFTLLGIAVFGLGGVGDGTWHTLLGIEEGVEALLSPTHLLLAGGGLLLTTGPLSAAIRRSLDVASTWRNLLPALLSALYFLSVLTFFTEYVNTLVSPERVVENPFTDGPEAFLHSWTALGVAGALIPAALITGMALFLVRRWALPTGALALVVSGNGLLMALFHYREMAAYPQTLLPLLAGGPIAEIAYAWLKPSAGHQLQLRLFAFLVPFALYATFFATLILTTDVWWTVHLWAGVPFLAGIVGLMLSFLAVSPANISSQ